jgi:hypothetical protein
MLRSCKPLSRSRQVPSAAGIRSRRSRNPSNRRQPPESMGFKKWDTSDGVQDSTY